MEGGPGFHNVLLSPLPVGSLAGHIPLPLLICRYGPAPISLGLPFLCWQERGRQAGQQLCEMPGYRPWHSLGLNPHRSAWGF